MEKKKKKSSYKERLYRKFEGFFEENERAGLSRGKKEKIYNGVFLEIGASFDTNYEKELLMRCVYGVEDAVKLIWRKMPAYLTISEENCWRVLQDFRRIFLERIRSESVCAEVGMATALYIPIKGTKMNLGVFWTRGTRVYIFSHQNGLQRLTKDAEDGRLHEKLWSYDSLPADYFIITASDDVYEQFAPKEFEKFLKYTLKDVLETGKNASLEQWQRYIDRELERLYGIENSSIVVYGMRNFLNEDIKSAFWECCNESASVIGEVTELANIFWQIIRSDVQMEFLKKYGLGAIEQDYIQVQNEIEKERQQRNEIRLNLADVYEKAMNCVEESYVGIAHEDVWKLSDELNHLIKTYQEAAVSCQFASMSMQYENIVKQMELLERAGERFEKWQGLSENKAEKLIEILFKDELKEGSLSENWMFWIQKWQYLRTKKSEKEQRMKHIENEYKKQLETIINDKGEFFVHEFLSAFDRIDSMKDEAVQQINNLLIQILVKQEVNDRKYMNKFERLLYR